MKKQFLLVVVCLTTLLSTYSFAQTNTFPSTGNVGIGTTSPSAALHVNSTDAKIGLLTITPGYGGNPKFTSTGTSVLILDGQLGTNIGWDNNTNGTHSVNIGNRLGLTSIAGFYNSSNSEVVRIANSGNVGIGTTSPGNLLTLNAPDYPTMPLYITYTGAGKGLSLGWRSIVFPSDNNSNISFTNAGGIYTGGSENLTLCAGNGGSPGKLLIPYGNVGIGTTSPSYKLDVNGNIRTTHASAAAQYIYETGGNTGDVAALYLQGNNGVWGGSIRYNVTAGGSNNTLDFYHQSVKAMSITINGRIGIGTTSPNVNSKLDVIGAIRSEKALYVDRSSGNMSAYFYVVSRSAAEGSNFNNALGNGATELADVGTAGLLLGSYSGNIAFGINGNAVAGRIYNTGNWYIGSSPSDNGNKFQVNGNIWSTGFVLPTGAAAGKVLTSDASGNASWQTASGGSAGWAFDGSTVGALKKIGTTDNYALPFITNNTEWMRITTTGNIGIGTTSPSEKLSVNGNILSKKVKVTQTGWADYVFHPSYKLPPLNEVEAYIKQHQHLPDIPSAKEIETNGLDLGNNQAALLKKIEELTLYMIQQRKEIDELKEENQSLQQLQSEIKEIKQLLATK